MGRGKSAIDQELQEALERLGDQQETEVLVYPAADSSELLSFLAKKARSGRLAFNVLKLAGCVAVQSGRSTITEIAARDDVERVTTNPTFTIER